ncbi:response regulator [Massilia sp. CCM 8733]|uniref:histidine kinase n=1 Tax=Massilia mucilaginosa TaxID=2609282 RepID=A0ABX0P149_9BURK|nr:ATP-binding protein [Massilia mucilaginosa]NHZ93021.1 response regulator [Massilia mucilaginosa]
MRASNSASVLLVNQQDAASEALAHLLSELGHAPLRLDAHAATAHAASPDLAVIVLDAGATPAGAGAASAHAAEVVALIGRLRAAPGLAGLALIVIAPEGDPSFPLAQAYAAGAIDVLPSPVLAVALKAKLAFLIDAHQTATRQRRSDSDLRDTRARLEITVAAAELATWTWDVAANRVTADAAMARLFNVPPEIAAGGPVQHYLDAIHPDDLAHATARIDDALASGEPYDVEYRVRGSDRLYHNVIARGQVVGDAATPGRHLRGVVIDITRQKQAEARLGASEERYRTLFDSIDTGVCIIEILFEGETAYDYRFIELNPAFVKHTGLVDAAGKTVLEMVPGHDSHWFATYGQVATSGVPVRMVEEARAMGRWFDVYATRAGGPGSRLVAVLFTDISERVAADTELRRLAADLSEADRRKTEFLATLAHELRNPLAPIRSGLQVMRLNAGDARVAARVQDIMDRQLDHLVALVDDLLDVARITRGQIALKPEWTSVQRIVADAVDTSRPLIDGAGHQLRIDLPAQPLALYADPTRVRQIVNNLLNNAARYTPHGGRIILSARQDGADVLISVSDNGIGIAADQLAAVFDMFTQVGRSAHQSGGLGIGLSLVRSLAEQHGGKVGAASAGLGKGSVFSVRLPLAPPGAPAATHAPATAGSAAPAGTALRVIVVDDNLDAAATLAELLMLVGHEVDVANDGPAALAMAARLRPHVMFLDIGMPGMDGYALAQALRQDGRHAGVLLVALTGWGSGEDRERTRAAGFDVHLTKPVDLSSLADLLAEHAQHAGAAALATP